MKRVFHMARALVLSATAAAVLSGCKSDDQRAGAPVMPEQSERELNEAMVQSAFAQQRRNGLIAERIVYPHYFQPGTASLNDLGEEAIETLLTGYRGGEVRVNVGRGGREISDELYAARVDTLQQRLAAAGLDAERITLGEGLGGGRGMSSEQVLRIYQAEQAEAQQSNGSTDGNGRMGSGQNRLGGGGGY